MQVSDRFRTTTFQVSPWTEREKPLQYTELQFLDDFGNTIDDLGLAQINLCTLRRLHRAVVKCRTWQGDTS